MPWAMALLLTVSLSAPFGDASARLIGFTPEQITIEVSVATVEPAALVLLRGQDVAGTELDPVALIQREDGTWGAVVELPARNDLRLVFELIPPVGGSILSEASTLPDLGIPPDVLSSASITAPPGTESGDGAAGLPWIILAVLAGLTALVLLGIWFRTGGDGDGEPDAEDDPAAGEHAGYDGVAVDGGG